ncbi:MAG: MerR family transcriptional regulator [Candidatus Omnitrophota bacterium]
MPKKSIKNQMGIIEAAKKIGIEMHRLYCWEQYGVVHPVTELCGSRRFRRYSQDDIERAKFVKFLVEEEGYMLKAAARKLNGGR